MSRPMRVTLHLGAHRTASTTLQRVMGASGPSLRAYDIAYWGPKRTRGGLFERLMSAATQDLPWQTRRPSRPAGRVQLALANARQDCVKSLLVSEENIPGTMRRTLADAVLYPDAAARLARVAAAFGPDCSQIGIALRSYDAWWASALAFQLNRGGPLPRRDLIDAIMAQPRRWRHLIQEVAECFPDAVIKVWSYEAMAARPEAILTSLLGPDLPRLSGIRDWHNASPTLTMLRQYASDYDANPALIREQSGRFMPFSPSERARLQADYLADLQWLRDVAGGQIDYIDDLGHNLTTTGEEGSRYDRENRCLARASQS